MWYIYVFVSGRVYLFIYIYYPADFQDEEFDNEFTEILDFKCDQNQALTYIKSEYKKKREDRQFSLGCREVANSTYPLEDCRWSGFVNKWEQHFLYVCPKNHIMTGMFSKHSESKLDRCWKYHCCRIQAAYTKSCIATGYVNDLKADFEFLADDDRVLVGAYSYYNTGKELVCEHAV